MENVRIAVKNEIANQKLTSLHHEFYSPSQVYGKNVFSLKIMRERLPKQVFNRLENVIKTNAPLAEGDADIIASAMKDWAIENHATHYTHWFQPMTGVTAEKHDAFFVPSSNHNDGNLLNEFSGKMLVKGEPDASSFPSGGIRSTFEARGYTAWDPTSPVFLLENSHGKTLYVPSVFISYTGESLDRKTPLLRSNEAVSKQALRILRLFGNTTANNVTAMVGIEQEYFLIDKRYALLRDDLKLCGRSLYGAMSDKGQELEDHYFGTINERVLSFMADVEKQMFELGIPAKTRHNEVAPAQFELAPVFEPANLAIDHNMLTMQILRNTAEKHGFFCLLHEKPFAGINGSGKHNNWSLCDSEGNNLLDPGNTPMDNAQFLVFLAGVLKAVHEHSILLRLATVGAGNDHRLGANEAPPAILSVFLGAQLTSVIGSIINDTEENEDWKQDMIKIGISSLPPFPKDFSDRNRTSPFAFTGNKFEFRAVGSSASSAPANIALNTAMANALGGIALMLETAMANGKTLAQAVHETLAAVFKAHFPIVFNGNGYGKEWQEEAKRRGLPDFKDTVSVLAHYSDSSVMNVLIQNGVLSERELLARQDILFENYIRDIHVEVKLTLSMGRSILLPSCLQWLNKVGELAEKAEELCGKQSVTQGAANFEMHYYQQLRELIAEFYNNLNELDEEHIKTDSLSGVFARAEATRDRLIPCMNKCRAVADKLEKIVDDNLWPLPKYNEMLW